MMHHATLNRPLRGQAIRRLASVAIRAHEINSSLPAIVPRPASLSPHASPAAIAPPRKPLPHEVPLSPAEVRLAIAQGICREPTDEELAELS
jgi:hypothetical protein